MLKIQSILYFCLLTKILADKHTEFGQFRRCPQKSISSHALVAREHSSSSNVNISYYEQLNHQWNLRIEKVYPLGYVLPTTTQDVQLAVKCGLKTGIRLIPKSGGHSYESFSEGNNKSVVIDFRNMNSIDVNKNAGIATIGPGALIGTVNLKTWNEAGMGIPNGQCHTVGVGGSTLGGGIGIFSMYGLTLGNAVEMEMVDAEGNVNRVSRETNPDLYWALRGVGSGFIGIVTSFKFKMFEARRIKITFVKVHYKFEHTLDAIDAWHKWLKWTKVHEPQVFNVIHILGFTSVYINLIEGLNIQAVHVQDEENQPRNSDNFLSKIHQIFPIEGRNLTVSYPNFIEAIIDTGYAPILPPTPANDIDLSTLANYPPFPRYFKVKSFYVSEWFSRRQLQAVADLITRMPKSTIAFQWVSAAKSVLPQSEEDSAYVHSNSLYYVSVQYQGTNESQTVAEGMQYIEEFTQVAKFMDDGETYQNFVDLDLGKNYLRRYYGKNVPKLLHIKKVWDPRNYFKNQQSLPV